MPLSPAPAHEPLQPGDPAVLTQLERACIRLSTPLYTGSVAWRRWGRGRPVVLLHGGTGSWRHWVHTIAMLQDSHAVHVPDLPGLGDSEDLRAPASDTLVGWAVAEGIRTLLPPQEAFDLVGFSFGAVVAAHVAHSLGDRVRSLTLVGPGSLGLRRAPVRLTAWRGVPDAARRREIHRRNLAALMIADPARIDALAVEIQCQNTERARLKSRLVTPPDALARVLPLLDPARLHVIYGERDAVVGPHMQERIDLFTPLVGPHRLQLVPAAGHWVAFEQPGPFGRLLRAVVAR